VDIVTVQQFQDNIFANLSVIHVVRDRIYAAISTIPETEAWLQTLGLLMLFTLIALPLGFHSGFLQVDVLKMSWKTALGIIATSLITPAVTEELFFRVLFLPQTTEHVSISKLWLWGIISLVMFVVYHPLNALSFFSQGLETFFNSAFLLLATLLGITCSLAYLQSGSLWTPVVIHWLAVVVWLLFLGGYRKLYEVVQK
jgi:predicted Abi (CAAX) family protease